MDHAVNTPIEEADGLPPGARGRAVLALAVGVGLAALDTAIANTALPAMAVQLHATPADSVWIVNAYQLAMVATLLPSRRSARPSATAAFTWPAWRCSRWPRWPARWPGRCRC